jgi:large subunit ribosomal protein L25
MSRAESGKSAAARLRREGRLPAVLFGHGIDSKSLSVDAHELARLRRHAGATTLVDLAVDGSPSSAVLIHGVQIHKVTHEPVHVDLFAVLMTEELTAEVPLVPQGVAPASEAGGTLVHPVSSVKVRALPQDLPESIHYDLSPLTDYEHVLTVADLAAPQGVTIQTDPSELIARVLAPRVEEAPAVSEALAAAPAEAAEPPASEG